MGSHQLHQIGVYGAMVHGMKSVSLASQYALSSWQGQLLICLRFGIYMVYVCFAEIFLV